MNWCYREPTLNEILSDGVIESLMKADRVDRVDLEAMLRQVAARRREASRGLATFDRPRPS